MVAFAGKDLGETANGVFEADVLAGHAGELFGDEVRLRQETLDLARARATASLSSGESSSMPRIAMMS